MKRIALALTLAVLTPIAHAAPPTPQQVDALLTAMDMPHMIDGLMTQMEASMQQVALSSLPADVSDADRARLRDFMAREQVVVRQDMTWAKLEPIYRSIYTEVFSADEVTAMTRFYASPEGHSILQKMPQATGRSMEALQPTMQATMQRVMADVQKEFGKPAPKQ
ncbi:DUF2059 domain-containing protein [Lysobacter claricitrinus]|uniref:DUF2059 domain-containing protein n=1 Tax=Lysobacter claricitrinus TaxID=3367728 RepID=UPI0038B36474